MLDSNLGRSLMGLLVRLGADPLQQSCFLENDCVVNITKWGKYESVSEKIIKGCA